MTKEEIEVRLNYLLDYCLSNPMCDTPSMFTNAVNDILNHIDQLQQENEALKSDRLNVKDLIEENEKQKEILDIIKNKCCISIFDLGYSDTVEEYNELYPLDSQLTDEEFKKLKEWLENE